MLFFVNSFFFSFKITWWYACWSRPAIDTYGFCILHVVVWNPGRERLVKKYFVPRCKGEAGGLGGGGGSCPKGEFCFSW